MGIGKRPPIRILHNALNFFPPSCQKPNHSNKNIMQKAQGFKREGVR
jgi:hypothetical protein